MRIDRRAASRTESVPAGRQSAKWSAPVAHPRTWTGAGAAGLVAAVWLLTRGVALAGLIAGARGDLGQVYRFVALAEDAGWYQLIVLHGYAGNSTAYPAAGFYPGYPLLAAGVFWPLHALASLTGPNSAAAARPGSALLVGSLLLVSNASLAAALAVLWRLYRPALGARASAIGLCFLLSAPGALFLSGGFSESSFILTTALAFLLATRGRWLWAGMAAAAACLIRPHGVLLAIPLGLAWLEGPRPRPLAGPLAGAALGLLGAAAFPVYTWAAFADPMLYSHLKVSNWGVHTTSPITGLRDQWDRARAGLHRLLTPGSAGRFSYSLLLIIDALSTAFAGLAALLGRWKLPWSHVSWIALMLLAPLTSGVSVAMSRYVLAAWPMFFLFGAWLRRWPAVAAVAAGCGCAAMFVLARDTTLGMFVG